MDVCCDCCVLSSRGLCDGLITRPEEPYGCLSVVSVVCCQVEVCATGWSLVQRSPMDVCRECWVLSGRGLCDALITHPEESYRLWCVIVCDLETSRIKRPWPALRHSETRIYILLINFTFWLYMFRTVSVAHWDWQLASEILIPLASSQHNLYDIHLLLCV